MQFDCLFALKYPRSCMASFEAMLGCTPAFGLRLLLTYCASDIALLLCCTSQRFGEAAVCLNCRTAWRGGCMSVAVTDCLMLL